MNELTDRVAQAAQDILDDKKQQHIAPLQATRFEILQRMAGCTYGDVLEAMRQLCRQRRFIGRRGVNGQELLTPLQQ